MMDQNNKLYKTVDHFNQFNKKVNYLSKLQENMYTEELIQILDKAMAWSFKAKQQLMQHPQRKISCSPDCWNDSVHGESHFLNNKRYHKQIKKV